MKHQALKLCIIAATGVGTVVLADGPDWTYLEPSYLSSELGGGVEPDGFELKGSWLLNEWTFLDGSYSQQEDDIGTPFGDLDLELDVYSVGFGARFPFAKNTDLYARASYEDWKLELESLDTDENGYGVAAGIRSVVWEGLEFNAEVGYLDVGDAVDGEGRFKVGGIYTFRNGIGVGASYGEIDELETVSATLRYSFR